MILLLINVSCASTVTDKPSPWFFYENGEIAIEESLQLAIQTKVSAPAFEKCLIRGERETVKVDIKAKILVSGELGFLSAIADSKNEQVKDCIKSYLGSIRFKPVPNQQEVNFKQRFVFKISH